MKKSNLLALAFAFGLLTTSLLTPLAYAEDAGTTAEETTSEITEDTVTEDTTPVVPPATEPAETEEETTEAEEPEEEVSTEEAEETEATETTEEVIDDEEETTEEVEPEEVETTEEDEELDEETTEDEEAEEEDTPAETLPFPLPQCEAVFKSFDGQTIKYGGYSHANWAITDLVYNAMNRNTACLTEYRVFLNTSGYFSYDIEEVESASNTETTKQYSFNLWVYGSDFEPRVEYQSEPITLTLIRNDSEARDELAEEFASEIPYNITLTGDEIKEYNAVRNHDFTPTDLKFFRDLLDLYPNVTFADQAYLQYQGAWKDEDGEGHTYADYSVLYYVDGYLYGTIYFNLGYDADVFETAEDSEVSGAVAAAKEENVPSDAVFSAAVKSNSTATSVLKEDEKVVIVYDLSLVSPTEGKITQFPYGLLVELYNLDANLFDLSMPVYARYIDVNGNAVDSDIPVTLDCRTDSMPMSLEDDSEFTPQTVCTAAFVAHHLSDYALINSLTPNKGVEVPATGYATAEQSSATSTALVSTLVASLAAALAGAFAVARKKAARK